MVSVESQNSQIDAELARGLTSILKLRELGFEEVPGTGGRFVQRRSWRQTLETKERIGAEIARLREVLDNDVNDLYSP